MSLSNMYQKLTMQPYVEIPFYLSRTEIEAAMDAFLS